MRHLMTSGEREAIGKTAGRTQNATVPYKKIRCSTDDCGNIVTELKATFIAIKFPVRNSDQPTSVSKLHWSEVKTVIRCKYIHPMPKVEVKSICHVG